MKRNKKLFQLYATSLSSESQNTSTKSPASPTEVSSNDSNTTSYQRNCVSPPTISCSPALNTSRYSPTNSPLSNNLSNNNNIANLLMPYAPTTKSISNINPCTSTNSFFPRPTHLSKLSPPSPSLSKLSNNSCSVITENSPIRNRTKEDLYSKMWNHIDSFSLQTNIKIHKQNKTKPHSNRRVRISISDLLCE